MAPYRPSQIPYKVLHHPHVSAPCDCHASDDNHSLAMAYVPWQTWRNIYDIEKGFHCGTIFKDLNLPFIGKRGTRI